MISRIRRHPHVVRATRVLRIWRLAIRNGWRWLTHKTRRAVARQQRRQELDEQFAIRSATDVARELGNMKGVLMKVGQLMSFIYEALPDNAQQALATLQADAPPMSPSAAAAVVREELGMSPQRAFLDWTDVPIAAASIGQVHRAVSRDGREVAVKVQYPGIESAITADLDNAESLYRMAAAVMMKGLDPKGLVDELRDRMGDELDYRIEATNQTEFVRAFAGHPMIRVPAVVAATSTKRVLTTEWADGWSWNEFVERSSPATKSVCGEVVWRFAQHSVHRLGRFNGDPHPGNYRFHADGSVTFLDYGLVKTWSPGEWSRLAPTLDAIIVNRDAERLVAAMEEAGFLRDGHGLRPDDIYTYVSAPYRPYLSDEFTFTRDFVKLALQQVIDVNGPYSHVIKQLNMPPSFVILDRVVWGVSAILGKLNVTAPFRAMLMEYVADAPPATELGVIERDWRLTGRS